MSDTLCGYDHVFIHDIYDKMDIYEYLLKNCRRSFSTSRVYVR